MQLSIIVPVYNTEKYLPRCLHSLLRQGSVEMEVICVNDGSTDGTAQILEEYANEHPNVFRIITQENQGCGPARDAGLRIAQGEYIGFLDADDYVIDGAYSYLYEHFCRERKPDMLSFCHRTITTDGTQPATQADEEPQGEVTFDGNGVEIYNRQNLDFQWTKFYRRQFLQENNIHFKPLPYFQDERFNFDVFASSPHLIMTDCNVVRWEQGNENSSMHTVAHARVLLQMDSLLDLLEQMNTYLQDGQTLLAPAARRVIYNVLNHIYRKSFYACLSYGEWKPRMHRLKSQPIHRMDKGTSRMGRLVDWAKNMVGSTYLNYLVLRFLHVYFIRRLIV